MKREWTKLDTKATLEGEAIRVLSRIRPANIGNHSGILWNTSIAARDIRNAIETENLSVAFRPDSSRAKNAGKRRRRMLRR